MIETNLDVRDADIVEVGSIPEKDQEDQEEDVTLSEEAELAQPDDEEEELAEDA